MCGRFVSPDEAAIERTWRIVRRDGDPLRRSFNVRPTAAVPILRPATGSGTLELAAARWGLIPHWWGNARPPNFTFNARLEEAPSKPMWRDALRRARCLIPAEGWYEWRERGRLIGAARGKEYRQPYYIRRRDGRLFAFAGLLSRWTAPGSAEVVLTCTILTTAAEGPLAAIHDRMPVVVADELHAAWLDPALREGEKAAELARSRVPLEEFEYYPVGTRVNDGRADGPELIEPVAADDSERR
jgi:putative SOS response-associated peptidase YedK